MPENGRRSLNFTGAGGVERIIKITSFRRPPKWLLMSRLFATRRPNGYVLANIEVAAIRHGGMLRWRDIIAGGDGRSRS